MSITPPMNMNTPSHTTLADIDDAAPATQTDAVEPISLEPGDQAGFTADLSDEPSSFTGLSSNGLIEPPPPEIGVPEAVGTDAEEVIRTAAYHRYERRLTYGSSGDEVSDWLEAEQDATRV